MTESDKHAKKSPLSILFHRPQSAVLLAVLAAALAAAGCATTPPSTAASGPATFHVDLGYEDTTQALEAEAFFPNDLTIDVGDTIIFTLRSHEPHTITFNAPQPLPDPFQPQEDRSLAANPVLFLPSPAPAEPQNPAAPVSLSVAFDGTGYVNSGFLQKPGDTYSVTFTKPGTWQVLCLLHPEHMKGTIVVNPAGSPRPKTDEDYRLMAQAQVSDDKAKAESLLASLQAPAPVSNTDGSTTYTVYAGLGNAANGIDFMRYIGGEKLTVKVGDLVNFVLEKNSQGVPHTITFLSGGEDPDISIPQPQPSGPPKLLVNPKILMPSPLPPAPYEGSGYYNSGLLLTGGPSHQSYTITFTKPGTFQYQCIFHDEDGMKATVTVQQ